MEQKNYNVVGVMSGTSLDGIDCTYAKISMTPCKDHTKYPTFTAKIIKSATIPYSKKWKETLSQAHSISSKALKDLNENYTLYLGEVIKKFLQELNETTIDLVCSHGHTILHNPDEGYTVQIGNLPVLAKIIDQTVVCDFRVQDVAMGGQGAPLVPIGDALLFKEYDYCVNLGGFANLSHDKQGKRIAYDICPVNVVLNKYAEKLGMEYDAAGEIARSGKIHQPLLSVLNKLPFYQMEAPKSLGIEWVHKNILPYIDSFNLTPKDCLATFTEHIALQILACLQDDANVFVTGGGAYNTFLIERLRFRESIEIIVPDNALVEFKEALIFGLLGVLKIEGLPNCLASVTGARQDHSSGVVFLV